MAKFFQAWDTIPPWSTRPADAALEQRIAKLAEFAAKNGPPFVEMMREKQANNPEYSFLSGGVGSDYFRWRLYCGLYNLDAEQPLQMSDWQVAPHQFQQQPQVIRTSGSSNTGLFATLEELRKTASCLPAEVDVSFARVLATLNSTRASIKESKEWFMARAEFADGLASKMAVHQQALPTYEQQICVIYLANDVLLKSLNQRPEGSTSERDLIAAAFQAALPIMLHTAFISGSSSPEVHQRLMTILDHWAARSIYSPQTIAFMKQALTQGPQAAILPQEPPVPAVQDTQAHPGGSVNERWPHAVAMPHEQSWAGDGAGGQPLSHMFPQQPMTPMGGMGWGAPPGQGLASQQFGRPADFNNHVPSAQSSFPGMGTMGYVHQQSFLPPTPLQGNGPGFAPNLPPWPQTGMSAGPVPEEPLVDPMSFPPGLLPSLVKEHQRTEEKYHPLDKQDVNKAGIPEPAAVDAYLTARLEKFAAELRDYRPGTSRADLEGDEKRQRTRNNLGDKAPRRLGQSSQEGQPTYDDGSFKGEKKDGGPAGLGFGATPEENADDPFNQYRKKRSGFYHDSLSRAQAAAAAKLQAAT